ncbi:MAG: membrane protein insertase YidC [Bacteroidales bacterium]|jgi:YidC/Oxa1 family membrane protein insertase|nr:membrane protein insertase YidC [Bacteroidales bacterium]
MDKNTIVGLLLIFAIVLGVSFYNSSQQKKVQEEVVPTEVSLTEVDPQPNVDRTTELEPQSNQPQLNAETQNNANSTTPHSPLTTHYFYTPDSLSTSDYVVETDKAIYRFSKLGGYLKFAQLKDIYGYAPKGEEKPPLVLFDGNNTTMNILLELKDHTTINTHSCFFASAQADTIIIDEYNKSLSLKIFPITEKEIDSTSYIEYLYTFKNDDYSFGFRIHFVNMQNYLFQKSTNSFTLQWNASLLNVERNYDYEKNITSIYYMNNMEIVDNLSPTQIEKQEKTQLKWVSFKQQFFTTVLIADSGYFSSGQLVSDLQVEPPVLKNMNLFLDFDANNLYDGSFDMSLYIGPNQYKLLKTYNLNLERQVPIGWSFFLLHWINRGAVIPIFDWLSKYGISYGIIILILTILLKIVLLPIAYKTYLSSARMRVLKPEIEEVGAKFPKSEDAMKKQQATMALYRSAGVNPMSGCLPVLLQMPILIAMFRFFPSAYELRQQPFLWADDLSTYDSVWNLGFNVPFYGDHVSLFCLLMTAATLIYTWLNNKMMTMGNKDQMKMMRIFMYLMPIMFLGFFNNFSSGLTYYYLLVNLITFFQMWIFKMGVDEAKIRARLKENMAKPKKKSKWQTRMEEMVRQQKAQNKRKN